MSSSQGHKDSLRQHVAEAVRLPYYNYKVPMHWQTLKFTKHMYSWTILHNKYLPDLCRNSIAAMADSGRNRRGRPERKRFFRWNQFIHLQAVTKATFASRFGAFSTSTSWPLPSGRITITYRDWQPQWGQSPTVVVSPYTLQWAALQHLGVVPPLLFS